MRKSNLSLIATQRNSQSMHSHGLVNIQDKKIPLVSRRNLASETEQAGVCLKWSEIPKRFPHDETYPS